jgi:uncharacterized protein
MKAERAVVDTNVLISALLSPNGTAAEAMRALGDHRATLLFSDATFMELATRLAKPKFDRYRTHDQMRDYLDWLGEVSEWVVPSFKLEDCRDPDDNRFLEVLMAGEGDVLLTGDSDLLDLHPYHGRPIVSPASFLAAVK